MIILAVCLGFVGWGSAMLLKSRLLPSASSGLMVMNFRGRRIPAVGGPVLFVSLLICAGVLSFVTAVSPSFTALPDGFRPAAIEHLGILLIAAGFLALGLFDDISDGGGTKGLRGHAGALRRGIVTSGMVKAAGGLALAFIVSVMWEPGIASAALSALVISASANLLNLLDLRPGRACKFYLLAWLPLALLGAFQAPNFLLLSAGLTGAAAGWLPHDLGEKGILGDSGSNMLGGVAGAGIVLLAGPPIELVVLATLLLLTLASEKYSFTEAIAGFGPLRWFDRLGRAPE